MNIYQLSRYNLKIIFGGKFVYFILAAFLFYLGIGAIMAFDSEAIYQSNVFGLLILPSVLLVFYPSIFGIQNDVDQRTIEIIFGIPDYRYKVWLVRFVLVDLIVFVLLIPFALLSHSLLISFPIIPMVLQLMVIVLFTSSLGFCLSTLIKNGNATAVVMVIIGVAFLVLQDAVLYSKWNIFLNPYLTPDDINDIVWQETIRQNRLMMLGASLVLLLLGLLNLQNREKFLKG